MESVEFEYERVYNIINVTELNSLSLGYVEAEETSTEKKDANSHYLRLIEEMTISYDDIERFTISCRNVEKTIKELNKIINSHKGENIVIVPLNNKVSTIAVAITVFNNPEVQICYGQPVLYNEESYSVPGNDFFVIDLRIVIGVIVIRYMSSQLNKGKHGNYSRMIT